MLSQSTEIIPITPASTNANLKIPTLTNKSTNVKLQESFPKNKFLGTYKSNIDNLFTSIIDKQSLLLSVKLEHLFQP